MRHFAVLIALAAALLAAVPTASAQQRRLPAAPVLVAPFDGRQVPPPLRAVTFEVRARRIEAPGTLGIQFTDADGTVDRAGRFQAEGGVDDFRLEQVAPRSRRYRVTVPASAFQRYGDKNLYWQAYRILPKGSCRPDCFQQSRGYRAFTMLEPIGYGNFERNDTPATATTDFFNSDCAYLERRDDVDWFRHEGVPRPMELRVVLQNWAGTDRWVPLGPPRKESASMSARVLEANGMRVVAARTVAVGKEATLRVPLAANTPYLIAFAHAGNGFASARPAANMFYRFRFNFPSDFDFAACG